MAKKRITITGTETGYKRFLSHVNLYALGLDSVSADIQREAYAIAHAEASSEILRLIESSFELIEFSREHFDIQSKFTLRVRLNNARGRLPTFGPGAAEVKTDSGDLLCIQTSFTAHFHCKKCPAGKTHAQQFAHSEARLIFWPYFRQTVSDLTAKMSIRPIIIPLTLSA
jgi:hypothetical protein